MSSAPHVLYVVWGFPPCRGSGVHRALATANAFAANGWRVTVLTAERDTFERLTGADPSLEKHVDSSVSVVRIPFRWPAQETEIGRFSRFRVTLPGPWRRLRSRLDRVPFPESGYGPWRRPLTEAARAVHAHDPVDLVVATANPNVTFAAAHALWRRHRVPYIMDYRDAWSLDVFDGGRLTSPRSRAARLEKAYLAGAREVWFVNEPIRAWHAREHPRLASAMHVVANGWDPTILDRTGPPRRPAPGEPLTFGYLGTVSAKVPLAELLEGWTEALDGGLVPPGSRLRIAGHLGFFAVARADMLAAIERAGDAVDYVGPVPKTEVSAFYRDVDATVLALGRGRYVTSGKVFEYLAAGKPIVSVHHPENAATEVLRGYPLWAAVDDVTPEAIAVALGAGARLAVSTTDAHRDEARSFAERYRRDLQFQPRLAALREAVTR